MKMEIDLDDDIYRALKAYSGEDQVSINVMINECLWDHYVDTDDKEMIELMQEYGVKYWEGVEL